MGALSAARHAASTLGRNPVLFVVAAAFAVVQVPQILLQWVGLPLVASVFNIATVVVTPFLIGGIYGMAWEGLDGTTSLGTFWRSGRENYVRLLVASIFFALVVFVIAFVGTFLVVLVALFTAGAASLEGGVGAGALLVPALVALAIALVVLVAAALLQFYEAAIVVDDEDVLDSLKRSYRFVRANPLGTAGFTLVRWGLTAATSLVTTAFVLARLGIDLRNPDSIEPETLQNIYAGLSATDVGIFVAMTFVTAAVVGAFTRTYLVAFYVDHREAVPEPEESEDPADDLFDDEYDTIG